MEADKGKVLQSANQLAAKGQFDKAIAEWKKLLTESPNDGTVHNNIGDLHIKRNSPSEAIEAYLLAGAAFHASGSALKSIAVYKKILKLDPARYSVYQQLGDLNAERGLVNNAVSDYLTLSKLFLKDGRTRDALAVYRKIVDLDPTNLNARQRLAELCLQENYRDDAVKAYFHLAKECVAQDQVEQACKAYKTIIKIDPGNAKAERLLKDPKSALQEVQQELSRRVGGSESPLEQAQRQMESGEFDQAETVLSDLLSTQPGDPEVCRLLAMLHLKRGELAVALSEIQFLSEAAIRAEDYGLAESMIFEYLKADQGCVALLELLGSLYEHKGDHPAAAIQYGKAVLALLQHPDPEAPDRPTELLAKVTSLDPSSPMIAELNVALTSASPARVSSAESETTEPVVQAVAKSPEPDDVSITELSVPAVPSQTKVEPSALRLAGSSPSPTDKEAPPAPVSEAPMVQTTDKHTPAPQETGVTEKQPLRFAGSPASLIVEPVAPPVTPPPITEQMQPDISKVSEVVALPDEMESIVIETEATVESESIVVEEPAPEPITPIPTTPQITEHEYNVHYELGVAYKNMEMLDEAIEEFGVAINGKGCFLDAATLLAATLKEKGLIEPAIEGLEAVLADPRCDQEKSVAIRYELGMLYEADGLWEKAVNIFSLIPSFLDVPMRLERLKSGHSSHQTEHDSTTGEPTTVTTAGVTLTERKKRRISYL